MNGSITTPTEPLPSRVSNVRDIEASCATPVLLMFCAAVVWLVLSSVFGLITSVKLHSSTLLAGVEWLSYGRTRPAAADAFAYGFASQAGLGVALWLICRLGRARLFAPAAVTIAALFWNLGVALGVIGILRGDTTGFELFEFPTYASAIFFAGYLVIATCALVSFSRRQIEEMYPSQWFILGALLWLPWVYMTARVLLVWYPVRGAMQFLVNAWAANGIIWLWLAALAIAVLYYFIPKLGNGQLYSRPLAVFGFWTFAVFAPLGGLYPGVPLPNWIVSVSIAGAVLTLIPLIANVMNLWQSRNVPAADCRRIWFTASLVCMAIAGVTYAGVALCPISALTVVSEGLQLLAFYGVVGFALFGAILYITPRLTNVEGACSARGKVTWWCTAIGLVLFSGGMMLGGLIQGRKLLDPSIAFVDVMNALKMPIRMTTLGLLLLVAGNVALLTNVFGMVRECCRACCGFAESAPKAKLKPAKAR